MAGICMIVAPLLLLISMILERRVGASEDSFVIGRVGDPDMLVGVGGGGWTVLRGPGEDWEHTPEHTGFRPLPGM